MISQIPPWNYHNLLETQPAGHDYFFRSIDDVESVIELYASSNCLHFLAGERNNSKINGRKKKHPPKLFKLLVLTTRPFTHLKNIVSVMQ